MAEIKTKKKPVGFNLRSIKCPNCGASISMCGGHNVTHVICSYCNNALEIGKDIQVAYAIRKTMKPSKPLKIGQKGKIRGVDYAVIGLVKYEQRDEDGIFFWLEYLLFSPTHGYVWLCYEDCHWVLVHEVKDIPIIDFTPTTPIKTSFQYRDKTFKLFECAYASIAYLEGELTWDAKIGEKILYSDSICPPYMFCTEKRNNEIEYFYGEYIFPKEIQEAFGYETPKALKVGPCEPVGSKIGCALTQAGCLSAIFAFMLCFMFSGSGSVIAYFSANIGFKNDIYISEPVLLDDANKVYSIEMYVPSLNNSWAYADIRIIDEKEEYNLSNCQFNASYYHGVEDGESWSEGSSSDEQFFKIPEAGNYKFVVEGGGNYGETSDEAENFSANANITIRKGVRSANRVWRFGLLLGILSLAYTIWYVIKDGSRWSVDDDDDDD